jgi:hypothetical protein
VAGLKNNGEKIKVSDRLSVFSKQESCQASLLLGHQQCLMGADTFAPLGGQDDSQKSYGFAAVPREFVGYYVR